jgi:hypothetical protein
VESFLGEVQPMNKVILDDTLRAKLTGLEPLVRQTQGGA